MKGKIFYMVLDTIGGPMLIRLVARGGTSKSIRVLQSNYDPASCSYVTERTEFQPRSMFRTHEDAISKVEISSAYPESALQYIMASYTLRKDAYAIRKEIRANLDRVQRGLYKRFRTFTALRDTASKLKELADAIETSVL